MKAIMSPISIIRSCFIALLTGIALVTFHPLTAEGNGNVYVSRFWHNHQPIYWPEWNGNGSETERVQYAWDSIVLKPGQVYDSGVAHPENDLAGDVFPKQDRVEAYQGRPRDSLTTFDSRGGFAISYSGSLISNIRNLGNAGQLGYGGNWWDGNREASEWRTPAGGRRLDLVGFTYHHSLGPLLPKEVFRKELQIFKQAWWKAWDKNADLSDHSKGFFPTEMAFSQSLVDVLVDEGYEWSIVASHHVSRTCPTYNTAVTDGQQRGNPEGAYGIFSSPPNKADQIGPSPTTGWWYGVGNVGETALNVSPHAYQLHKVKYVNPETGGEKAMLIVPSDDILSYRYGYASEGIGKIQANISPFATDPSHPVIAMPSTDGDNAWGGGSSSWMEATPQLFNDSLGAGYQITTPQDFVNQHGAAATYAHVEDGAWIFPESDYGSPYFLKWLEPPLNPDNLELCYPGTKVDLETPGFALKFWSWAPVIAGANWCETAEQLWEDDGGSVEAWKIEAPYDWDGTYTSPNIVERAWHIYLAGLDSGFNYYGGLGNDDEVKQSLATRRAIELLQTYVNAHLADDATPPTVLKPQRFPWNPGAYTFGWFNSIPSNNNALKKMPSEFYIWTHAYDVSGVVSINVKVRIDGDGLNTMANNDNETYSGGPDVGSWTTVPMTKRVLPNDTTSLNAAADNGQINYFSQALSPEIADYYFAKITDATVFGFRGKLLDYYIEASDGQGNIHKSEIQHVYVEDDGLGGGGQASDATFSLDPRDCAPLTVTYKANDGVLSNSVPVTLWLRFTNTGAFASFTMTHQGGGTSTYTAATVPDNAPVAEVYFQDAGQTITDNHSGANWSTTIRDCEAPTGPSSVSIDPPNPDGCGDITIAYYPNGEGLQGSPIYIHVGYNGFQNVLLPNPAMTQVSNHWEYVYSPAEGTYAIDMAFNNGALWDNNGAADWHFAVSNCNPVILPPGVVITNPVAESITVSTETASYFLRGSAGANVTGPLTWSNAFTGASGTTPSAAAWAVPGLPLAQGTNVITVSALAMDEGVIVAEDDAGDAAYADDWITGDDGGSGWGGGWLLNTVSNAGHFRASGSADLDTGSEAWGMWANSGGLSEAYRPFASPLAIGEVLSMTFENGFIDGGGAVGFGLQNAGGTNLLEFLFVGGRTNYTVADAFGDRNSGLNFSSTGFDVDFERTGADTYRLEFGTLNMTGSLVNLSDQSIARVRLFNYNAGSGGDHDFFFNQLRVLQPGGLSPTSDTVSIIREIATLQDGIPVSWWQRYGLGGTNKAAANWDDDPASNWDEWVADTDPTNPASHYDDTIYEFQSGGSFRLMSGAPTTNSRMYDVWVSTDLVHTAWSAMGLNVPGALDGSAVELYVPNGPGPFFRTGVKIP